jgi:hypothetical protein
MNIGSPLQMSAPELLAPFGTRHTCSFLSLFPFRGRGVFGRPFSGASYVAHSLAFPFSFQPWAYRERLLGAYLHVHPRASAIMRRLSEPVVHITGCLGFAFVQASLSRADCAGLLAAWLASFNPGTDRLFQGLPPACFRKSGLSVSL